MVLGKLKSILGMDTGDKRYHTEGEVDHPTDTTDPHTWRNESKRTWRDKAKERPRTTITYLALLTLGLLLFLIYSRRYFPGFYENEQVRQLAVLTLIFALGVILGMSILKGRVTNLDWLVLDMTDGAQRWLGEYDTDSDGNPRFKPVKGLSWMGLKRDYLRKGDLSNEWARLWAKNNATADEPARIRLWDSITQIITTDMGTLVVQPSKELRPDTLSRESDLVAIPPDQADPELVANVNEELKRKTQQLQHAKIERDIARDQRDEAIRQATDSEKRVLDGFIDRISQVFEAYPAMGPTAARGVEDAAETGVEPDTSGIDDRVDDQLQDE